MFKNLIDIIKKNGLLRLVKVYTEIGISRVRGLLFGVVNTNPRFPKGLRVGHGVRCVVRHFRVGENVVIGPQCSFGGLGTIVLKSNVVMNRNSHIDSSDMIVIGENSLIGPDCYFVDSNHIVHKYGRLVSEDIVSMNIHIEDHVLFGRGVTVLTGVSIGEKSTIGAGAVVSKSIPANSTAVGIPARCIK